MKIQSEIHLCIAPFVSAMWLPKCGRDVRRLNTQRERSMGTHSTHQIAVVLPITIALMMIASTMVIHSLALVGIVDFIRRQRRLGRTGVRFWQDVAIGLAPSRPRALASGRHL